MDPEAFFFDSYAIIEIIKGNPAYAAYKDTIIVITQLNLFEVYQAVYELLGENEADQFLEEYSTFVVDFSLFTIKEAAIMRLQYRKRNISMTDCVGYCLAKQLGRKFLTSDKEFEHFDNVEWVP